MKKVISFDLDDVIYDLTKPFVNYINKKYGKKVKFEDIKKFDRKYFSLSEKEEDESWKEFLSTEEALKIKPNKYAINAIKKLKKNYRIIIITKRDYNLQDSARTWIRRHLGKKIDKVYFTKKKNSKVKKSKILLKEKAILHIDDKIENIIDCLENKIPCLLVEKPWSKDTKLKVQRVKNVSYKEIIKLLK